MYDTTPSTRPSNPSGSPVTAAADHLRSTRVGARRAGARPRGSAQGGTVLRRLFEEWEVIARRPALVRRARTWDLGIEFDDLDGLVEAVGFRQRPVDHGMPHVGSALSSDPLAVVADEVLGRLLVVARTDELAARVVLQRLLPGLCAAARRWTGTRPGGTDDAFDEIVSAAWVVIRVFPVERRPGQLAPKLLRDAEHQAFVKATRRKWTSEAMEPATFDRRTAVPDGEHVDAADELAEVVELARSSLSDYDLRLLTLLRSGRSMAEVAEALAVSVRTVSYHRDALVQRMRTALVA
jgi:DNA-binding CsgD family transcriptional regulator